MAVTSDQLLEFLVEKSAQKVELDANGEVLWTTSPVISGDALAHAIKHVSELAAHETGIGFAERQYNDAHPQTVSSFMDPRPGN